MNKKDNKISNLGIIHSSDSILENGNILRCTTTQVGYSCSKYLFFGLYLISWEGTEDPKEKGYQKIFGKIYFKL